MAAGAFTAVEAVEGRDATLKHIRAIGTITVTAGDYATGGLPLDLSTLGIPSQASPYTVTVQSRQPSGSGAAALFLYNFNRGTTQANGKLQIFTGAAAQSGLAELGAGALPAGVVADVLTFEAWFLKL